MTSTEFVQWLEFIELDYEMMHREDLFIGKLTAEVRRGWVAKPKDIDDDDFIKLKLVRKQEAPKDKSKLIERVKQMWITATGARRG